jgi:hypothetical protein
MATRLYGLDDWGSIGFDSRRGLGNFLFTTASILVLGLTQSLVQWVAGAIPLGVKRPGLEADHSPPSSAEAKKCVEIKFHSPNTLSWRGAQLKKKHRDYFTLRYCSSGGLMSRNGTTDAPPNGSGNSRKPVSKPKVHSRVYSLISWFCVVSRLLRIVLFFNFLLGLSSQFSPLF